jgi:uncharacterized Zn-binding protein involved in type VI secretion
LQDYTTLVNRLLKAGFVITRKHKCGHVLTRETEVWRSTICGHPATEPTTHKTEISIAPGSSRCWINGQPIPTTELPY